MIQKMNQSAGNVVGYKISGTVIKVDYDTMVPEVEALVKQYGTVELLLEMTEFKWEKVSAWGADMKFGRDYHKKIEKMAIVGDKKMAGMADQSGRTLLCCRSEVLLAR